MPNLPATLATDLPSTWAFALLCLMVALSVTWAHLQAVESKRSRVWVVVAAGGWLSLTFGLAASGVLATFAGSMKIGLYLVASNGFALVLALSPLGRSIANTHSALVLILFQSFRLPLELILHHWFSAGLVPQQMTFKGSNYDIVTGILAVLLAIGLWWGKPRRQTTWWVTAVFSFSGLGLLIAVTSIAVRSAPWPLRTFTESPPLLLPFYAPHTWIVSVCVAGALWGHVVLFRWLWTRRDWGATRPHS